MRIFDVTWLKFKEFVLGKNLDVQFVEASDRYHVLAFDEYFGVQCDLMFGLGEETVDFETNFKTTANKKLTYARDRNGNQIVVTEKGAEEFATIITHDWTDSATWQSPGSSVWKIGPSATNKKLIIPKSEVQFTHDVKMASLVTPGEFYFDVWAFNPLFNPGQAPTAESPNFVPGVSEGNPLRVLAQRTVFTSIRDVFNYGNAHYTMNANVDDLQSGVTTVQFNYDQKIVLHGSFGMEIRFSTKDNLQFDGSFFTVSLIAREENE